MKKELLVDKVEIVFVFIGLVKPVDVRVIQNAQYLDLVLQNIRVFDKFFVDDLDTSFRVGRLFECSLINCSVSATTDGLNESKYTLWWNLYIDLISSFLDWMKKSFLIAVFVEMGV